MIYYFIIEDLLNLYLQKNFHRLEDSSSFICKRKIASTLTLLGGCFAATNIKLCESLPEGFLTWVEALPKSISTDLTQFLLTYLVLLYIQR